MMICISCLQRDDRTRKGETEAVIRSNNPYNVEEIAMPLHEFINDPIVWDLVHNGATFQVLDCTLYGLILRLGILYCFRVWLFC